jgi:heme exporter protein A
VLEILNISCSRGDRVLFHHLSFTLTAGELLHITGRNGSGKTTLLRTICTLTRPLEGQIKLRGVDVHALGDDYRSQIAYVGHLNGIQGELTPFENLRISADAEGTDEPLRIETTLVRLQLDAYRYFPAKVLSQGQKRRLALARLLLLNRPLWVLDEPFSALDVESVTIMGGLLADHLRRGGMVLLTSHHEHNIEGSKCRELSLDS